MKKSFIAAGGSLVLLLGACSTQTPSASKFKSETEKFLKSSKDIPENFGQKFTDATCETPSSNAVGTSYVCQATGEDATVYNLTIKITSKSGYTVEDASVATATPATGDTTPLATTATT
ncbi:MAG: hypothetical protein JWM12_2115 [Ilumatobacteraceae bacterium]|nr:hypothetical protein [Ilumatobacteraceae bacterium]